MESLQTDRDRLAPVVTVQDLERLGQRQGDGPVEDVLPGRLLPTVEPGEVQHVVDDLEGDAGRLHVVDDRGDLTLVAAAEDGAHRRKTGCGHAGLQPITGEDPLLQSPDIAGRHGRRHEVMDAFEVHGLTGVGFAHRTEIELVELQADVVGPPAHGLE